MLAHEIGELGIRVLEILLPEEHCVTEVFSGMHQLLVLQVRRETQEWRQMTSVHPWLAINCWHAHSFSPVYSSKRVRFQVSRGRLNFNMMCFCTCDVCLQHALRSR